MIIRIISYISTLLLIATPISAREIILETGITQTTMVELYTSEGCSSCPPAEHFLNDFKNNAELWKHIIPLAFHVDYWDYIGWKDRFAQAAFGLRQSTYAQLQRRSTVYTPAFFINGHNWRPGFFSKKLPMDNMKQAGSLKVTLRKKILTARFNPLQKSPDRYTLNIALLGMGITTNIKAGENEGRKARHEFVVLDHQQYRSEKPNWKIHWSPVTQHIQSLLIPGYAIAAWVTAGNHPSPVQATGGYLPDFFNTNN